MSYTSLHGHTDRSNLRLLDCISKPEQVLDRAHELGLKGVAITDHECLSSFITAEKYLAKKKKENPEDSVWQAMRFLRGNEIYLVRNDLDKDNFIKGEDQFFHFLLLARDPIGYQQLCELSGRAWYRMYKHYQFRVPTYYQDLIDVVGKNPGHLIGSSACLGSQINTKFLQVLDKKISREEAFDYNVKWVNRMKEILGSDCFYLELQPGLSDEQIFCNQSLLELAMITNTATIITTDHHYTKQEDRVIHKAYLTSKQGEREVDSFYEATYMMSAEEIHERMKASFGEGEETFHLVNSMLSNTNKIADMCEDYSLLKPLYIPYIPTKFDKIFIEPDNTLMKQVREAIPNLDLFLLDDEYCNRQFAMRIYYFMIRPDEEGEAPRYTLLNKTKWMNNELGIIWESGKTLNVHWSKYLLMVSDYLEIFWTEGDSIVAPSRGSAGASYACHALGINQIDPTREQAPLVFERFMNPERASVLDIDTDIQANRRNQCIQALINTYGEEQVTRVSTFKTEKARSAILTAARGIGLDVDTARYIASLCKAPRGIPYTLTEIYHGDVEKELAPNKEFIKQMSLYPRLWEVAEKIEGLISGVSVHAGGVIITEEPIVQTCSVMRTTGGDIVTAYDLHEIEEQGLIKIDLLSTECLSKIRTCLDLLTEYGYIEPEATLKETYEKVIGVYSIDRNIPEMWEMVHNNEIISLFQMEQQSGVQGMALTKPETLEELALLNSLIRLMPADKQSERPLEKFAKYKKDPSLWDSDMNEYGLTEEEKQFLHSIFDYSSGIAAHQEDLYALMTSDRIVGYGFGKADQLRKAVAKKTLGDFQGFEEQFWIDVKEKGTSLQLAKYIWNEMIRPMAGYGFNMAHTLSYSLIALQEMNLAYHYPILFWNTANLIVDSGAEFILEEEDEREEPLLEDNEDSDDDEGEKKNTTSDYGKMASAIGRMQQRGISILPPDINRSRVTFTPDPSNDTILYGLKGITRIGNAVIESIIENRNYVSVEDFLSKVKVNKPQVVNLIKSGAFDSFGERTEIMDNYINSISDAKHTLNLRNVQMLIRNNLFPVELSFEIKVFNFNKYIRKGYDKKGWLLLDETALRFYNEHFDIDKLEVNSKGVTRISEPYWKNIYNTYMDVFREYISGNQSELLNRLNFNLTKEVRDKYAYGSVEKWSMDAVNFYQGKHELEGVDLSEWNVVNFWTLPEEPQVKNSFRSKQGYVVNMYHLNRIAGTVIDKDPLKSQITLLTTKGVVTVQAYGVMAAYDKQISEVQKDGKKKIMERSWFTRGTKIIVNGMRRGEHTFVAKKYKNDKYGHHFYKITDIVEGKAIVQEERYEVST